MQIQLNTDDKVQGGESLTAWARSEIKDKLARFGDSLTRIEVHLSEVGTTHDATGARRCTLEARLAGRAPVAVSHDAPKVADALHAALDKLVRLLDTTIGRGRDAHGRDTIRGIRDE